jgi:two-component system response regulator PilR (NtrC family)
MNGTKQSAAPGSEVTVLVVDDDPTFHNILADAVLAGHGYRLLDAFAGWQCIEMLAQQRVDVVLLDLNLPDGNGFRVLEDMRLQGDTAVAIVVSAYLDSQSRQRARAAGAWEVIDKRFEDYRQLPQLITRAMNERAQCPRPPGRGRRRRRGSGTELPMGEPHPDHRLRAGELHPFARLERSASLAMQRLINRARDAADRSAPVLIRGEPGSERELVARYIHGNSKRSHATFVATVATPGGGLVSALGPASAESLFAAGSGTIFIDQIHQLDRDWQDLLLAFLDRANDIPVVGARVSAPVSMTARVVVASTEPVDSSAWLALDARLREAWSGSQLVIPPLRERLADVAGELEFLLAEEALKLGVAPPRCTPEVMGALSPYQFPGNEHELRGMAMLACVRKPGAWLELYDLLPSMPPAPPR